jgi:oligopeptide transport system substrate-binding protein
MQGTADLDELIQSSSLDQSSYNAKCAFAKEILEKLVYKFPKAIDRLIFKELDRIVANLEAIFFNQRQGSHLAKLAYSIYFIRRKIARDMALLPFKDYFDIRIFPSFLYFTFGSKPVLSIMTHARLKDKYEIFDEEQILFIIRKFLPEAELVKDSVYAFQPSKHTVKTLYFEIYKKSGLQFSSEEVNQLKKLLKREIKFSIEQLVPRVFMIRNEEEILKNILILSREIHFISDFPQVMILFDQQTPQEAIFTIILVKLLKPGQPSTQESFAKVQADVEYIYDRCQIVQYFRKKYPLEANVFRVKLFKNSSLLRGDNSLNFYLARQKISRILTDTIGEFRDYNGGIIIKQREALASFRDAFRELSIKEPDLLENFYYSLSPIEMQATLSLESLRTLFGLFLEARDAEFTKPSDYFFKIQSNQKQLFVAMRTPDENLKKDIDAIFSSFQSAQKIVTCAIAAQNTHFLGYLLLDVDLETQLKLSHSVNEALKNWKLKIESRQILRLSLEHPIVSLDPRIGGDETSAMMLKMLFEGLMRINKEGNLENGVAQNVKTSPDQKTYFFELRSTLWSNGSPVSAYDFEYAWKKVLSPSFKTPFAYLFYPIKNAKLAKSGSVTAEAIGVKALNDLVLKVELEFPSPYFLELTAHTIYSPINRLVDQRHPNWVFEDKGAYICNGAFQLKKNHPNEGYELIKNQLYWDAINIKLDEIAILKASRYHGYEMFQKNMNHWIGSPLGTWDPSFAPQENDERIAFLGTIVYWFAFNTQRFPFKHKKIRQALAWGINRSRLKDITNSQLAYSPIPPVHSQVDHTVLSVYSLEEAKATFKEALKELNMSLRDFPIIPLTYLIGPARNQVAHFIKEEWERAFGIRCSLESLEWKVLFSKMTQGDFQVGGMTWESWINDPIYTLNAFRDANEPINFPKWENKQYQKIMHLAEREIDLVNRRSFYLEAEKLLLDEMPVVPISLVEAPALKKKNFNIKHSSPLINFKWGYFA